MAKKLYNIITRRRQQVKLDLVKRDIYKNGTTLVVCGMMIAGGKKYILRGTYEQLQEWIN